MLHPLQEAAQRGVPIITFNPLRERGLERFTNPQNPIQMIAGGTRISTQYHQVRAGGDAAAIVGICKAVIEADDAAKASGRARIVDVDFHRAAHVGLRGVRGVLPRAELGRAGSARPGLTARR